MSRVHVCAGSVLLGIVASGAWAGEETFAFTRMQRGANAIVDAFVFNVGSDDDNVSDTADVTFQDFPTSSNANASAAFGEGGASASCTAGGSHTTTFAQQKDGSWAGSISGSTSATTSASGAGAGANSSSSAFSNFRIEFSEGQVHFTATGSLTANTNSIHGSGTSRVRVDGLPETFLLRSLSPPVPDLGLFENQPVNVDLTLDPGTYIISFGGNSTATIATDVPGMDCASGFNVDFTISHSGATGGEPDIYFWDGTTGDFDDMANWDPEGVPGTDDIAIFDKDIGYAVHFGVEEAARSIVEHAVLLRFDGQIFTLNSGTADTPSFIVGESASTGAFLNLDNGFTLDTQFATIGQESGANGLVDVGGSAAAGWLNSGTLKVGDGGEGSMIISSGGRLETDTLALGYQTGGMGLVRARSQGTAQQPSIVSEVAMVGVGGEGTVEVADDIVSLGTLVAGVNEAGFGHVNVSGESGLSEILCEALTIGDGGSAALSIGSSSTLTSADTNGHIGKQESGNGAVYVDGCGAMLSLPFVNIGGAGLAFVEITGGGLYQGDSLVLGQAFSSSADIFVTGKCEDDTPSRLVLSGSGGWGIIGSGGEGVLRVADGARCEMTQSNVGFSPGGVGLAVIAASTWTVSGNLDLGVVVFPNEGDPPATGTILLQDNGMVHAGSMTIKEGSGVYGNGVLQLDAPGMCEGTVGAGVWIQFTPSSRKGGGMPLFGRSRGHGTLTVQGGMDMQGGEVDISIGGLSPGQYDRIHFDGDGALEDVTLRLRFTEGFAPQTGDTLPILSATGNLTATNLTLLFEGLADGFQYQINSESGMLEFEAMSDGEATSPGPTDLNVDGNVNAVDVQLAINAALGLVPVATGDVNFDGASNAVDVQLVINGALGVG